MNFTLEIELGNEAMQTGQDIAELLKRVAVSFWNVGQINSSGRCNLHDENGNRVGQWAITLEDK